MNTSEDFRSALSTAGLDYRGELIADGKLHRFKSTGDHNRNSWFVLFSGTPTAGAFGCWKRGFTERWCERSSNRSQIEWNSIRARWKEADRERERGEIERHAEARKVAGEILAQSRPTASHPYLSTKGVQSHVDVGQYDGDLLIPLRDANGVLHSLQFVKPDGSKKFLTDGRVAGCSFTINDKPESLLIICEGFATGASIFEATRHVVVCAMNAGNLMAVSKALREKFPHREIIITADNDQFTDGNPGLTKATEAALAIGARLAVPQFKGIADKPTDFNDLHQQEGLDIVKAQIESAATPKETDEETFERLATLSPVEYDRVRDDEAKRLNIRVGTLDLEVMKRRPKSEPQTSALEPWPEPVDGASLLDEIRNFYRRFVIFPTQADVLVTVWTLMTYVFQCFENLPYLNVKSPLLGSGKSTLADAMQLLCSRATEPGGMTAAAMFRRIERLRPTLLLDEWDSLPEETRLACINILNTGYKESGVYTICVGDDHEEKDFSTYCPKAIFGIQKTKSILPDTTRSRCFEFTLQRKLASEQVVKLRKRKARAEAVAIQRRCHRWANDYRELLNLEPVMPDGLTARQEDISEPLFSVADQCGQNWPEAIRAAVLHACGAVESEESGTGISLLRHIKSIFSSQSADRYSTADLCRTLNGNREWPYSTWNDGDGIQQSELTKHLKPFGILSHSIRISAEGGADKVHRGYYVTEFQEAFDRYLPDSRFQPATPATNPVNIEERALFKFATDSFCSGRENSITANKDGLCSAVAAPKPENRPGTTQEAMRL